MTRWSIVSLSLAAFLGLAAVGAVSATQPAQAQDPYYQGVEVCAECHRAEHAVWEETRHSATFREMHRNRDSRKIVSAASDERDPRKSEVCTICHYTMSQKGPDDTPTATSGPSCESCHGPSSQWFPIHNDYGGKTVTKDQETAEHREQRIASATEAGMIWPAMKYDVAENCMECHGLANEKLDGDTVSKMIDAGHPTKTEFEVVQYSQGSVRHRFYPPDVTVNKEMPEDELAHFFVVGKAAKLVSATQAMQKTDHAKYQEMQSTRAQQAREVLETIDVPEAKALLDDPTEENARAFVSAIDGMDLTGTVGGMLPAKDSYK